MKGDTKEQTAAAHGAGQEKVAASNLTVRTVAALVLAPLVLLAVWAGVWPFFFLVAGLSLLMAREWTDIVHAGDRAQLLVHAAGALAGAAAGLGGDFLAAGLALAGLAWLASLWLSARAMRGFTVYHVAGVPYLALPAMALVMLRGGDCGLVVVLLLLAMVWSADTLAYFAGRGLGGPRLAPRISPNKTWAGFLGAVGGGALAGLAGALVTGHSAGRLLLAGALIGAVEQLGDLFESAVKRRFGVKDSGSLIPGHGGVLDRVDGLVAAAVVLLFLGLMAGGGVRAAGCALLGNGGI
jgi:phosphatidate cytidylyltransferase